MLVPKVLSVAIAAAFVKASGGTQTPDALARTNQLADDIAMAIDAYVRGAVVTVTVSPGIPVVTAGSPTAQTGSTIAAGVGTGALT